MKLRTLSLLLILALLFGCSHSRPAQPISPTPTPPAAPHSCAELAGAVLSGFDRAVTPIIGEELNFWLLRQYGLPEGSWADAAIYRAADPMYAFEIAVLRFEDTVSAADGEKALADYLFSRRGDFFGYDPEQAAVVENSRVARAGTYLALLICEDPALAEALFLQGTEAAPGTLQPPPAPTPTIAPTPEPTTAPIPEPTPEPTTAPMPEPTPEPTYVPSDGGRVYDTSAIAEAWNTGETAALSDYDLAIYRRCEDILSAVLTDGMSDYEKERAIYRWVTSNIRYDYDHYDKPEGASPDSATPYNPLLHGKGICTGFATTFKLLAELAGLECIVVSGRAFYDQEDHAWNMIRLNGEWYCLDPTWDMSNGRFWRYFNVTDQWMAETNHQWDENRYPAATAADGGKG